MLCLAISHKMKIFQYVFKLKTPYESYDVEVYSSIYNGVKTYFLDLKIFSKSDEFYTSKSGSYSNANVKFGFFCKAVVEFARLLNIDILHLNDWHTALCALLVKEYMLNIKTVLTIHNLAYQGVFEKSTLEQIGINQNHFNMDSLEFYDKVNFLKAGIAFSDAVTTVSKQYAKEIQTEANGCGLHSFLKMHSNKLTGIVNGIDYGLFNPKTDQALNIKYDQNSLNLKEQNKLSLLKESGLTDEKKPLFVMISRLVEQKGFDLIIEAMDEILKKDINLLILSEPSDGVYKNRLELGAKKYKNFSLFFTYDEEFSHRIYAGADFLLMPSRFEPCGLNQMIAMRYATLPVVSGVGGLLDTVHEKPDKCGRGIVIEKQTKESLLEAIERSIEIYNTKETLFEILKFNMECDFSFAKGANIYKKLYNRLVG